MNRNSLGVKKQIPKDYNYATSPDATFREEQHNVTCEPSRRVVS